MIEQEIKIKIGEATFKILFTKERGWYHFTIYRKQKEMKKWGIVTTSSYPKALRDNLKTDIAMRILRSATYEINHEIEKLEL